MFPKFIFLRLIIFLPGFIGLATCFADGRASAEPVSDIKSDEVVVFFRTSAWLDVTEKVWNVPIRGWVYEKEKSFVRKALFSKLIDLVQDIEIKGGNEENYNRRINLLLADSERNKHIVINIAGRNFTLPPSEPNGHFNNVLSIPVKVMKNFDQDGFLHFSAVTKKGEKRTFYGQVQLINRNGISVISDIDDTVKITHVTDFEKLIDHTLYKDFIAVPGMAELYKQWSSQQVAIHFVSSSPWQLYSPLVEFVDHKNFPWATFNLKLVRFRDKTVMNLFKSGTETKPREIEPILKRYPKRKFILVGDSGEQDPEVYAGIMYRHPAQIIKIFIRNTGNALADDSRFVSVFSKINRDKWQLFTDPSALKLPQVM